MYVLGFRILLFICDRIRLSFISLRKGSRAGFFTFVVLLLVPYCCVFIGLCSGASFS